MVNSRVGTLRGRYSLGRRARRLAPILPLWFTVWCTYDAIMAIQQGRTGKVVRDGIKALLSIGVASLMHDAGKRISES